MNLEKLHSKGFELYKAKNFDAALKVAEKLQRLDPKYKKGYYLEAAVYHELENSVKEYLALKKILSLLDLSSPKEKDFSIEILSNIRLLLDKLHLFKDSFEICLLLTKITTEKTRKDSYITNAIFYANTFENFSAEDFQKLYDEYEKTLADVVPYPKKFYDHKKIRVGFISADFFYHPALSWSWTLLNRLDKNFFETYFYSNVKKPDIVTENLRKTADGWHDIRDLTDEQAAKLIRDDEIDILFDLSGHTLGHRLRAAAYRPASVQMSGIGYMNSTGLDCFDYFLSDIHCAGDENFFTEKVIKLPHSHICYEPPTQMEPAKIPPCMKNNFVTFGSFNQFGKVTDSILIAWKKILNAVPNSKLILKHKIFNTSDGKNFAKERLKNFGVDVARVELRPYSTNHLAEYADVDIALDTFPYTGGVTTCEALFMGVPVVSLFGKRHGTRFGLSILKNVGLDELAVDSYDDYVKRAVMLAGDWELLTLLRKNLRPMMKQSPLMDSESYVREMEKVFLKIVADAREQSA